MTSTDADIREAVRERYANAAVQAASGAFDEARSGEAAGCGCGTGCGCAPNATVADDSFGAALYGADALFLNTSFSGPQLTDVVRREKARALIYDEEFEDVLSEAGERCTR